MHSFSNNEPTSLARSRNVSGLLFFFITISLLAHGLTLLVSEKPSIHLTDRQLGTRLISTVLTSSPKNSEERILHSQATESVNTHSTVTTDIETSPLTPNIKKTNKPEFTTPPITQSKPAKSQDKTQTTHNQTTIENTKTEPHENQQQMLLTKQRNYLLGELQNKLSQYLSYPQRARRRGWQGRVVVAFHINNLGRLNDIRLEKSSGYSLLDRSAVSAIRKLEHIALPEQLGPLQATEMSLPVSYELKEG